MLEIRLDSLLISSGSRHHKLCQNKKNVTWIQLCLLDINYFSLEMANGIDLDNLYMTSLLLLSINYLWGNCKILKGICCLQLFIYYTITSVFVVNFLQSFLFAFWTFFFCLSTCCTLSNFQSSDFLKRLCLHASSLFVIQWGIDFFF